MLKISAVVSFSLFKKDLFILFLAVVSLSCCTWNGDKQGLFVVVHGLLIAVASHFVEHRL